MTSVSLGAASKPPVIPLSARERKVRIAVPLLLVLLCGALLISVGVGPMQIGVLDSLSVLSAKLGLHSSRVEPAAASVIESIRLPRTLLAMLVGAALAVCGAAMQGLFRNPLADPGLVGVTGGASLAAVSVIVLGGGTLSFVDQYLGQYSLMLASFLGALLTTSIVARIATTRYGTSVTSMLLAGIAIGIVTGAAVGFLTYVADDSQLRTLTFWSMGSVGGATWQTVLSAGSFIALPLLLIPTQAKALNALLLGESEARHLGIDVEKVKRRLILLTAVAVGACVSVSGMIGFVGLIVPHLVRLTLGPDHRHLLVLSALLGALFLLIADMLSRTVIAPAELPIGLITTLIGGPFFIAMVVYRARSNAL